jgi:hypothetical protein
MSCRHERFATPLPLLLFLPLRSAVLSTVAVAQTLTTEIEFTHRRRLRRSYFIALDAAIFDTVAPRALPLSHQVRCCAVKRSCRLRYTRNAASFRVGEFASGQRRRQRHAVVTVLCRAATITPRA